MELSGASTASGIIWTMPVEDCERVILPPVVQHAAICYRQPRVSGLQNLSIAYSTACHPPLLLLACSVLNYGPHN